jgi:hypothetical protein
MALSLAQAAVLSQDDLQRGVIETFVQESVVLDRLPLLPIEGNAYAYNKEATLPGVAFRSVNEGYTESTGTFVQDSEGLVIMGGDADVDRFIVQTRGNLNDQRAAQTRLKVKAASYAFQDAFINGDVAVDSKAFDGLKKRLTGSQVLTSALTGSLNADDASRQDFFDEVEEAIAQAKAGSGNAVIYTNRQMVAKIKSAGRRIGGVEMVKEDMTGKRVVMWNGIPVLDIGQTAAGADIIPVTTGKTDLYVVRFGQDESDGAVTGLTNGGVSVRDLGEVDDKPVFRTRIEFYCGLATFGGNAAARLAGVTL